MRTSARERSNSVASINSDGSHGGSSSGCGSLGRRRSATPTCDIVKTGYLHIKRPPTFGGVKLRIKTWQKRYIVLRDQSYDCGTARLDIFTTESGWHENDTTSSNCYSIDLVSVNKVEEYTESKNYPNALVINRPGLNSLILGAKSDFDVKEWIVAISLLADKLKTTTHNGSLLTKPQPLRRPSCPSRLHNSVIVSEDANGRSSPRARSGSQSSLRVLTIPPRIPGCSEYLVKIDTTDASKRKCLTGEYHMSVSDYNIIIRRPCEPGDVIRWSIGNIRKFKSEDLSDNWNLVTLEANVHCGEDSGLYLFRTHHGRRLIDKVKDAISKQNAPRDPDKDLVNLRSRVLNKAPSTPNLFNRVSPPKMVSKPPLPHTVRERTQSNPEQTANPNSYLQLLSEGISQVSNGISGDYIGENVVHRELSVTSKVTIIVDAAPTIPVRHHSGLPPLPRTVTQSTTQVDEDNNNEIPPQLPPRQSSLSASPPPPPPRPQHTLSTNSLPV